MRRETAGADERGSALEHETGKTSELVQEVVHVCRNPEGGEEKEHAAARALLVSLPPYFSADAVQKAASYLAEGAEVLYAKAEHDFSGPIPAWLSALYAYHQRCVTASLKGDAVREEEYRERLVAAVLSWQKEATPESRLSLVRELHAREVPLQDAALDLILGIHHDISNLGLSARVDWERFVAELTTYTSTPYAYIAQVVSDVSRQHIQSLLDVGSGTGRMLLYGSAVTPARLSGVESNLELVRSANAAAQNLGLEARAMHENALQTDMRYTDAVYVYNPFYNNADSVVQNQTQTLASRFLDSGHPGKVLYGFGYSNSIVESFTDLEEDTVFGSGVDLLNPMHSPAYERDLAYRPRKFVVKNNA